MPFKAAEIPAIWLHKYCLSFSSFFGIDYIIFAWWFSKIEQIVLRLKMTFDAEHLLGVG